MSRRDAETEKRAKAKSNSFSTRTAVCRKSCDCGPSPEASSPGPLRAGARRLPARSILLAKFRLRHANGSAAKPRTLGASATRGRARAISKADVQVVLKQFSKHFFSSFRIVFLQFLFNLRTVSPLLAGGPAWGPEAARREKKLLKKLLQNCCKTAPKLLQNC